MDSRAWKRRRPSTLRFGRVALDLHHIQPEATHALDGVLLPCFVVRPQKRLDARFYFVSLIVIFLDNLDVKLAFDLGFPTR